MSWRGLYESWQLAHRLDGPAGRAMHLSVEEEASRTTSSAVRLARRGVEAADAGCWGTALGLLQEAGAEAAEVIVTAWWPWLEDGAGPEEVPARVAPARPGKADALFAAATALGQLVADGAIAADEVAEHLLFVARRIGLTEEDAVAVISGGLRHGMARGGDGAAAQQQPGPAALRRRLGDLRRRGTSEPEATE